MKIDEIEQKIASHEITAAQVFTQMKQHTQIDTKKAFEVLKKAFKDDPDYAHGWHCNIAMMCYDAMLDNEDCVIDRHEVAHKIGNEAASRFMKLCFDVVTTAEG